MQGMSKVWQAVWWEASAILRMDRLYKMEYSVQGMDRVWQAAARCKTRLR